MAKFQPGQSGNPNGRPKKGRALTEILEKRGAATYDDVDGKRRSGKAIVARALWEIASTGKTTLVCNGVVKEYEVGPKGWFEIVKWIYSQIDGPPTQRHEMTGDNGGPIELSVNLTDAERARRIKALLGDDD